MKMTVLPRRRQLVVIATRRFAMLADKTLGGDVDDVRRWLTGSTAACRPAVSSCCMRYSFPSKQIRVDLGKSGCSKQIR